MYTIVGPAEANPREGRISNESPLGRALMDHRAGDMVTGRCAWRFLLRSDFEGGINLGLPISAPRMHTWRGAFFICNQKESTSMTHTNTPTWKKSAWKKSSACALEGSSLIPPAPSAPIPARKPSQASKPPKRPGRQNGDQVHPGRAAALDAPDGQDHLCPYRRRRRAHPALPARQRAGRRSTSTCSTRSSTWAISSRPAGRCSAPAPAKSPCRCSAFRMLAKADHPPAGSQG